MQLLLLKCDKMSNLMINECDLKRLAAAAAAAGLSLKALVCFQPNVKLLGSSLGMFLILRYQAQTAFW